ncbi:unnamed protein product [Auanema sp. JU1783]|nr:unnamed protein product [Auanema sp. JU1783]
MTRCASPRCLSNVCEENVDRTRAVVARLKGVESRKKRKQSTDKSSGNFMKETCECVASTANVEEANPVTRTPAYDVFLGGSCGNTVWRRQLVIPFLKKRSISYYDPQRSVWSENMIYEESIAKENSSLFLFVIDPATVNATSFLEIAYFAARKSPKLVVVFLGKTEWKAKAHPDDVPDRNRTCQLLDRILDAHDVPMLHSIQDALNYIEDEIIGNKKWTEVLNVPCQRLAYLSLRTRRAARAAHEHARAAWGRVRTVASKAGVAGTIDTIILLTCQLIAPSMPLLFVIIPLFIINVVIIISINRWQHYRSMRPRGIVDSTYFPHRHSAAIPSPRMATVTTPLNPKTSKHSTVKAKRFCDELMVEDGSNAFSTPENLCNNSLTNGKLKTIENINCIELVCSSMDEIDWISKEAVPQMDGQSIPYSSGLSMPGLLPEIRMNCLKAWSRNFKHFFYHIPSTKTFLSGMVEIAYMLGHSSWQVTVCVPRESQTLEFGSTQHEDEVSRAARRRRNDCYQIAFCYLKDMAKRRQCRVFTDLEEAIRHVMKQTAAGF